MGVPRTWLRQADPAFLGRSVLSVLAERQVWYDDVIHRVSSDVLVLKPVGRSGQPGRGWILTLFGPSEYRHAVRFSSPELARRFYAVWMGSG